MRFIIKVQHADANPETWDEDYNRPEIKTFQEAQTWSYVLVKNFNATLRPGERPRNVVSVRLDESAPTLPDHDYVKQNLVTLIDPRGGFYDVLKCRYCAVSGRRYGLVNFRLDRKYRAQKWQHCKGQKS